jgi:hypothetical protein
LNVKRALRPRATEALTVAPLLISDRNCAHVMGIDPRDLREKIAPHVRHARLGNRIVFRVEDVLAFIAQLSEPRAGDERTVSDDLGGADGVLARIGRKRVG